MLGSGYCGDVGFLRGIAAIVKKLKATNPNLLYVCDPVLGDNSAYVSCDLFSQANHVNYFSMCQKS